MRSLCAWSRGWCSRCGPKMCVCLRFEKPPYKFIWYLLPSFLASFRHHCWCSFMKMERKENCSAHFHAYAILLLFTNEPHVFCFFLLSLSLSLFVFFSMLTSFVRLYARPVNLLISMNYILEWRILCWPSDEYSNENTLSWVRVTRWWLYISINRN